MSSIRLFVLDAFERYGDMHGHQLRLQAEKERVALWTDISVGALYGAIKRLASDGLLEVARIERDGNFPERHVYAITDAGRHLLAELHVDGLLDVAMRPDPFDLAIARLDPDRLDDLGANVGRRLETLRRMLAEAQANSVRAQPYLTLAEKHALSHREHRLSAEIAWHEGLLADVPAIVADERSSPPDS